MMVLIDKRKLLKAMRWIWRYGCCVVIEKDQTVVFSFTPTKSHRSKRSFAEDKTLI